MKEISLTIITTFLYFTYAPLANACTGAPCNFVCATCSGPSTNCVTCKGTQRINEPACVCAPGYYEDCVSTQCPQCIYQCEECAVTAASCTKCKNNRDNQPTCDCKSGTYEESISQECLNCVFRCQTCVTSDTNCIICKGNRISSPSCICPDGYFEDNASRNCPNCAFQCATCVTSTANCTRCKGNRINIPSCICQDGLYEDYISENCPTCKKRCLTCVTNNQNCITCNKFRFGPPVCNCIQNYIENSDQDCVPNYAVCQIGQYKINEFLCGECFTGCSQCTGPNYNQCTECYDPKKLFKNICWFSSYFYYKEFFSDSNSDLIQRDKTQCHQNCVFCFDFLVKNCFQCAEGTQLVKETQCPCPIGFWDNTLRCLACHDSCKTCFGSEDFNCITCHDDLNAENGYCICQYEIQTGLIGKCDYSQRPYETLMKLCIILLVVFNVIILFAKRNGFLLYAAIDMLQYATYLVYIDVWFPMLDRSIKSYISPFTFSFLPNPFSLMIPQNLIAEDQHNPYRQFNFMDKSNTFILNVGAFFITSLIPWIIIFALYQYMQKNEENLQLQVYDKFIRYNFTLWIFINTALALMVPAQSALLGPASYGLASIISIYFFAFLIFITRTLNKQELYHVDVHPRYDSLWLNCSVMTKLNRNHWTFMTLKQFIVSFLIVGLYSNPVSQILGLTIIYGIYGVYILLLSPYNNMRQRVLITAGEAGLFVLYFFANDFVASALNNEPVDIILEKSSRIGWVYVLVIGYHLANVIFELISLLIYFVNYRHTMQELKQVVPISQTTMSPSNGDPIDIKQKSMLKRVTVRKTQIYPKDENEENTQIDVTDNTQQQSSDKLNHEENQN